MSDDVLVGEFYLKVEDPTYYGLPKTCETINCCSWRFSFKPSFFKRMYMRFIYEIYWRDYKES